MKLGVMAALFNGMPLRGALALCREIGLDAIELPVGGYPGSPFFDAAALLDSEARCTGIRSMLADFRMTCSALAVHGNPVHPDRARARADHDAFVRALQLAPRLGTDVVITFSGCPAGSAAGTAPNWVTCAWPPDFLEILRWQWDDVLVPYWAEQARAARAHGVRIAWEPHPGFCVYNPDTLIRLAERAEHAAGGGGAPVLGANLDPSHFFWQGIDPVEATRALGERGLIFAVHAKDCGMDAREGAVNGWLDTRPYSEPARRSWNFRTCGWGHGDVFWKPFVSMLRRVGYDGVLSIEHEDAAMGLEEGLRKAAAYLQSVIIRQPAQTPWWC